MVAATRPVKSSDSDVDMRAKFAGARLPIKSNKQLSAFQRLGMKWGCKEETAKDRIYGERGVYQMVADANEAFLSDGLAERVAMLMAVVDASMLTEVPHWSEAVHPHNSHDALEDAAQADFIKHAGDTELEQWIKKLASDIRNAEVLLAALVRERDARKGK